VPFSASTSGEFGASSLTISVPECEPTAVGVKVTEIVQDNLAPNVFGERGQSEVAAKSLEVDIAAIARGTV
jgi:hypothetical protein